MAIEINQAPIFNMKKCLFLACYALLGDRCFHKANTASCILRVPAKSVNLYRQAPGWRNF